MARLLAIFATVNALLVLPATWGRSPGFPSAIHAGSNSLGIVDGKPISIKDAPYMAAIFVDLGGLAMFCGGSIIHKRFVLTAQHCFGNIVPDPRDIKVKIGAENIDEKDGINMDIEKKICHENARGNDICLLKLKKPIVFGEKVATIKLAKKGFEIKAGVPVNVTGWGSTDEEAHFSSSENLQQTTIPIVSQESCSKDYKGLTDNMVCAGSIGHDACWWDGGDPLTYNGVQIGIVAHRRFDRGCGFYPGVYTRVSSYINWIRTKIRENI